MSKKDEAKAFYNDVSPIPMDGLVVLFGVAVIIAGIQTFEGLGFLPPWKRPASPELQIEPQQLDTSPTLDPEIVLPTPGQSLEDARFVQQITLGRSFFKRLRTFDVQVRDESDAVRKWFRDRHVEPRFTTSVRPADADEELLTWWNVEGRFMTFPFLEQWRDRWEEFQTLVAAWEAGDSSSEARIRQIVLECGRDWLQVPYLVDTGRFALNRPLRDEAPESKLGRLKKLVARLNDLESTKAR